MRGMIYLPGLDKVFKMSKRVGTIVRIVITLAFVALVINLALTAIDPVRIAEKKAKAIMVEETEQSYRFCIRKASGQQELQRCKDQFLQDYK